MVGPNDPSHLFGSDDFITMHIFTSLKNKHIAVHPKQNNKFDQLYIFISTRVSVFFFGFSGLSPFLDL
jgi:hypothetical protein